MHHSFALPLRKAWPIIAVAAALSVGACGGRTGLGEAVDQSAATRDAGVRADAAVKRDASATDVAEHSRDSSDDRADSAGPDFAASEQADATADMTADATAARADSSVDTVDAAPARETGAEAPDPRLSLVAGGLGGSGDQDGVGAAARFSSPKGLAPDGQGGFFVADHGFTIRRLDPVTGRVTTFVGAPETYGDEDGTGAGARFRGPTGLANDSRGNLLVADRYNHTIRKIVIATGEVTTLAGSPRLSGNADGIGSAARFNYPNGLAADGNGQLFVADMSSHTIRKVEIATGAVTTLAGSPGVSGSEDGVGSAAHFKSPEGLASDGAGNLFVSDAGNNTIRKVVLATGAVTTVAGLPGNSGSADGAGQSARLSNPRGLVFDGAGDLYIADSGNRAIRKLVVATGAVSTAARLTQDAGGAADGGTTPVNYSCAALAFDSASAGKLLVTDDLNHVLLKVDIAMGAVVPFAGSREYEGTADGIGAWARFDYPWGLASDGEGSLFVADAQNDTIRQIVIATGAATTLAGTADVSGSADGIGAAARFSFPVAVASDGAGNLYVADQSNHTIRKVVVASAAVTTLAGAAGMSGNADGVGASARFRYPMGMACDGAGSLFVADSGNHTIRRIVLATGEVTTLAGSPGAVGENDGFATQARFDHPTDVESDGAGNLFVGDSYNRVVRRIVIATGAVTTLASYARVVEAEERVVRPPGNDRPLLLASDRAGSLYVSDLSMHVVRKIDLATERVTTVVGMLGRRGVALGSLPAQLSGPAGLAFVAPDQLFIVDRTENAVLRARF